MKVQLRAGQDVALHVSLDVLFFILARLRAINNTRHQAG
jgi:hypothetical protein